MSADTTSCRLPVAGVRAVETQGSGSERQPTIMWRVSENGLCPGSSLRGSVRRVCFRNWHRNAQIWSCSGAFRDCWTAMFLTDQSVTQGVFYHSSLMEPTRVIATSSQGLRPDDRLGSEHSARQILMENQHGTPDSNLNSTHSFDQGLQINLSMSLLGHACLWERIRCNHLMIHDAVAAGGGPC